jgi:hypothetical protein
MQGMLTLTARGHAGARHVLFGAERWVSPVLGESAARSRKPVLVGVCTRLREPKSPATRGLQPVRRSCGRLRRALGADGAEEVGGQVALAAVGEEGDDGLVGRHLGRQLQGGPDGRAAAHAGEDAFLEREPVAPPLRGPPSVDSRATGPGLSRRRQDAAGHPSTCEPKSGQCAGTGASGTMKPRLPALAFCDALDHHPRAAARGLRFQSTVGHRKRPVVRQDSVRRGDEVMDATGLTAALNRRRLRGILLPEFHRPHDNQRKV